MLFNSSNFNSNWWDFLFKFSNCFEIWQAAQHQCCQAACQFSKWLEYISKLCLIVKRQKILLTCLWRIYVSQDITDDKSTLVQVMVWCHQASSHYLNQCWPNSMSPYGGTRGQWVKWTLRKFCKTQVTQLYLTIPASWQHVQGKSKILGRPTDHPWQMAGWSMLPFCITMARPWALIQVCSTSICMVQPVHTPDNNRWDTPPV